MTSEATVAESRAAEFLTLLVISRHCMPPCVGNSPCLNPRSSALIRGMFCVVRLPNSRFHGNRRPGEWIGKPQRDLCAFAHIQDQRWTETSQTSAFRPANAGINNAGGSVLQ